MSAPTQNEPSPSNEFISFWLGSDRFAVEASKVRAVMKYSHITEVPGMPDYLPGVINLRGNVISVIDLCSVLDITAITEKETAWLVIAEVHLESELLQIGMLVNTVEDVIWLDTKQIAPPPEIGMKFDAQFVRGIGKQGADFTIILDIDKVVSVVDAEITRTLSEHPADDSQRAGREKSFK